MSGPTRRQTLGVIAAAAGLAGAPEAMAAGGGALGVVRLRLDRRRQATGVINPRPRFSWNLVARDPRRRGLAQNACHVVVERADGGAPVFDSGKIATTAMNFTPAAPLGLAPQTPYVWRVRVWDPDGVASAWSAPEPLVTGVEGDWRGGWIAAQADGAITGPAGGPDGPAAPAYASPLLRRAFHLDKPVRSAVLSLSGLGCYALSVNGAPASDALMNPGWTDYDKTVLYNTLDVTALLRTGDNVLGVRLAGGMYDIQQRQGRYSKFVGSYGAPKLIAQLRVVHTDGTETWVVSDEAWRTHIGPTTFSSIYGGEDEDARLEPAGWDSPGGSIADWSPVIATKAPPGALKPQATPGLKAFETFTPIAVTEPAPGIFVFDLGQNFAGRPVLSVRGPAGTTVRIKPAELLGPNGRADQTSMTGGGGDLISFNYTLGSAAAGGQVWRPRFSYTGFRYLEVEGAAPVGKAKGGAELISLAGEVLHADLEQVGDFSSDDVLLNRIHGLIRRAVLSNSATVLTDCPHREKLGWLEQTYLNAATVFYNLDALPLYAKTTADMADSQRPNGMVPSIAPELVHFVDDAGHDTDFRDSPEWGSAVVQSPWAAFRFSGDKALLEDGYPAMRRYAEYLAGRAKDGVLDFGLGDWYDRGPAPPGPAQLTSRAFTATATWFADLTILARIADLLGRGDEAAAYRAQAGAVKATINARFRDAAGRYDRGSQTADAMALALGLVPDGARSAVLEALIADIRGRNNHVSAGDIGFHFVVRALSEAGRGDVLLAMLSRPDAPSYAAQLTAGATALTEAWDANPKESQNHFMLGHAEAWLFGGLGGIDIDFARGEADAVLIAPQPMAAVGGTRVSYRSALGEIRAAWRIAGGLLHLDVEIPPGASARVRLPGGDVMERGKPLKDLERRGDGAVEVRIGSGVYAFTARAG